MRTQDKCRVSGCYVFQQFTLPTRFSEQKQQLPVSHYRTAQLSLGRYFPQQVIGHGHVQMLAFIIIIP